MYISLAALLSACEAKKEEVIDLNDIIPSSDRDYDQDSANQDQGDRTSEQVYFSNLDYQVELIDPLGRRLFPDRFGPDTSFVYQLSDSTGNTYYHKWVYEDSAKVMNALYNWIDCFGDKCKSLFIGEEKNLQSSATMILVSDSTLIYIESGKINFDLWYDFHEDKGYENDFNLTIEQRPRGRAKWFTFVDEKKTKYKAE